MNNKNVIRKLNQMWQKSEDEEEKATIERAILAVRCYRNCKDCAHRTVISKYAFCALGDCDYEPRSEAQKEETA